jgi:CTP:molybdopterin cytidylyltransferase MocA
MRCAAVLLAAGSASRMGHRPKSLLLLDGEPLIRRTAQCLLDAGIQELVVVLGHYAQEIAPALAGLAVTVVINPHPEQGIISSQRLGLQSISANCDAVVMCLADQPLIETQDITDLLQAFADRPSNTDVVFPQVQGQPGNPVALSAAVCLAVLQAHDDFGCQTWRQLNRTLVHGWASNNPHYITDLDCQADIAALQQNGIDLSWPDVSAL